MRRFIHGVLGLLLGAVMVGCSLASDSGYDAGQQTIQFTLRNESVSEDARARFREFFCTIVRARNPAGDKAQPSPSNCTLFLARAEDEPRPDRRPVNIDAPLHGWRLIMVPGYGADCFRDFAQLYADALPHLMALGVETREMPISGLSGTSHNARIIRDSIMAAMDSKRRLIVLAYSKGTVDVLDALVAYPELTQTIHAFVSIAGAVGGSRHADLAPHLANKLISVIPGGSCGDGDSKGLEDLRPSVRKAWLAEHRLPATATYYSLVTLPERRDISTGLRLGYDLLAEFSPYNDSQLLPQDQVIPGSVLLGYVRADHLAVALPIAADHPVIGTLLLDKNRFPRSVLLEAVVRLIDERSH